jgi:hypothetical protein
MIPSIRSDIRLLIVAAAIGSLATGCGPGVTPAPEPTPGAVVKPTDVVSPAPALEGLHVYTVSELLAERAAGRISGEQVALRGYWSNYPGVPYPSCGVEGDIPPSELEVLVFCADGLWGITEVDEPMTSIDLRSGQVTHAAGAHLTPYVDNAVREVLSNSPGIREDDRFATVTPVPVELIGHFDDPQAADCRPRAVALCRDRLVIDRLVSFGQRSP